MIAFPWVLENGHRRMIAHTIDQFADACARRFEAVVTHRAVFDFDDAMIQGGYWKIYDARRVRLWEPWIHFRWENLSLGLFPGLLFSACVLQGNRKHGYGQTIPRIVFIRFC